MRYLHYHYVVKEKIEDKKKSIKQYCFKDEEEIQKLKEELDKTKSEYGERIKSIVKANETTNDFLKSEHAKAQEEANLESMCLHVLLFPCRWRPGVGSCLLRIHNHVLF